MKIKILLTLLLVFSLTLLLLLVACKKQEIKQEQIKEQINESLNKTEQGIQTGIQIEINKTQETKQAENKTIETETKTAIIKIKNLKADPYELNISVGTTVIWISYDDFGHVIAIPKITKSEELKRISKGESWNYTFLYEGRYGWYSTPWPTTQGWINVK